MAAQELRTTLASAIERGDTAHVADYLDRGGNADAVVGPEPKPLLELAVRMRRKEIVALLLSRGARVSGTDDCRTAFLCLRAACARPFFDFDIARLLLDAGADVNGRANDEFGSSVLFAASFSSTGKTEGFRAQQEALVRLLLSKGAAFNRQERSNVLGSVTSARLAAILVDEGGEAEVDPSDAYKGYTPLFYAVNPEMVEFFVERGANIEARNCDGRTPLFHACSSIFPNLAVIEALLRHGADPNARDKGGKPIIEDCGPSVALKLMQWGAEPRRADRLVDHLSSLFVGCKPLCGPPAWLKWLVTSPKAPASFADIAVPPTWWGEHHHPPPLTRDEMVQPLKDDAWERRKHLVCCYFETRRRRKEARDKQEASEPPANTAAGAGSASSGPAE